MNGHVLQIWRIAIFLEDFLDLNPQFGAGAVTMHPIDRNIITNRNDKFCGNHPELIVAKQLQSAIIFRQGIIEGDFFLTQTLFFATLTGPGKVWLQSLPLSRLADRIYKAAPQRGGGRKEEGSVLDAAFGIGRMIDGD